MGPQCALILIDLQNDFLSDTGGFPVDSASKLMLLATLPKLIPDFRLSGGHVVWITSEYPLATEEWKQEVEISNINDDNLITSDEHVKWILGGTHLGKKPCCQTGQDGALIYPEITALIQPEDLMVTKTFYSAFKRTTLQEELLAKGIDTIYVGGLLSNMCVLATTLEAVRLGGLTVCAVTDALAWRRKPSHERALETMTSFGIKLVTSNSIQPSPSS